MSLACLPPRRESDLPQGIAEEMRPRRDHILRLLYLGTAGGFPAVLVFAVFDGNKGDPWVGTGAAVGAIIGYLAGWLQARWLWKGTMPGRLWAPWAALGWAVWLLATWTGNGSRCF